jgi:hypothetical protein
VLLYRRVLYSAVIVFMPEVFSIQLGIIMLMSVFMLIAFLNVMPFIQSFENKKEAFNEVIILICCYHVSLMSDYVPSSASDLKEVAGLSMVLVISLTALGILCSILFDLACTIARWIRTKYTKRKFEKLKLKAVKNKALQMLISMNKIDEIEASVTKSLENDADYIKIPKLLEQKVEL